MLRTSAHIGHIRSYSREFILPYAGKRNLVVNIPHVWIGQILTSDSLARKKHGEHKMKFVGRFSFVLLLSCLFTLPQSFAQATPTFNEKLNPSCAAGWAHWWNEFRNDPRIASTNLGQTQKLFEANDWYGYPRDEFKTFAQMVGTARVYDGSYFCAFWRG